MNHPNTDELMGFLYDELETPRSGEVRAHIATCDECRKRVSGWRGVRGELDAWELPGRLREPVAAGFSRPFLQPLLKWAVAAAVLLGGGYALARYGQEPPAAVDTSQLRAQLTSEIRSEVGRELAAAQAQFASEQAARNAAFEQAVVRAFRELEARQIVAQASLETDVQTLAEWAQHGFEQIASIGQAEDGQKGPQQQ